MRSVGELLTAARPMTAARWDGRDGIVGFVGMSQHSVARRLRWVRTKDLTRQPYRFLTAIRAEIEARCRKQIGTEIMGREYRGCGALLSVTSSGADACGFAHYLLSVMTERSLASLGLVSRGRHRRP